MLVTVPHVATIIVASIGACAGALVTIFPQYSIILGTIAAICAALAAPTITSAAHPPPPITPSKPPPSITVVSGKQ